MHFPIYSKYFYSKLTNDEKKVYVKIQDAWLNYRERIIIKSISSNVDLKRVIEAIKEDTPELFYLDASAISVIRASLLTTIKVEFLYSESDCKKIKIKILKIVNGIVERATQSHDKERFIHDYLVKNVKYSTELDNSDSHSIKGVFISKKAVCEGYSRAFKLLCDACKIPCIVVSGMASNGDGNFENHAWNIVRIKDYTYHVDVTWNCSSNFIHTIPLYYNVSDAFMKKDHIWETNKWPLCFRKGPIENNTIRINGPSKLDEELTLALENKKNDVFVEFTKTFSSVQEIEKLLSNSLKRISTRNIISSYSLIYSSKLDCVLLEFVYF